MMAAISHRFRKLLLRKRAAATRICALWRGYCVRAQAYDRNFAAARIQRAFRAGRACAEANLAAVDILAFTQSKRFLMLEICLLATMIQRLWKGWMARQQDELYKASFSPMLRTKTSIPIRPLRALVLRIQSRARGNLARQKIEGFHRGDFASAGPVARATFAIYLRDGRARPPAIMARGLLSEIMVRCVRQSGTRRLVPDPAGTRSTLLVEETQLLLAGVASAPRVDIKRLSKIQVAVLENVLAPLQA